MTQLLSLDETTQVGEIIRQYTGCGQECFTDASNFSVTFPVDLDVKMKAVIFGATMLLVCYFINYFYENNRHPLYWGYKVFPWVDWGGGYRLLSIRFLLHFSVKIYFFYITD